jgi:hypothetical protein
MSFDYVHDELITPYKGELETWYTANKSVTIYLKLLVLTAISLIKPHIDFIRYFDGAPEPGPDLQSILYGQ